MSIFWGEDSLFFFNDAFAPSIGIERRAAAMGRPGKEVGAEIWDVISPQILQVMSGDGATWHENQLVPIFRDGKTEDAYWTYSCGPIDADDAPTGVGGVLIIATETTQQILAEQEMATDVTARREADDALRHSEAQLRIILQAVPGVVYVKDRQGRMLMANQGTADLIGKPQAAFIGSTDAEFLDDKAQALRVMENDQRIMASGRREVVEEVVNQPDGRPAVWLSTKTPLFNAEGEVVGLIGSSIDFTEQREAREILARSREELKTERDRLVQMYEQAPGVMAILDGPNHIFTLANPAYMTLVGHREIIGKSVRDALPEVVGQGFFELLDYVFASGDPYVGSAASVRLQRTPNGPTEERFLDFVYQPVFGPDGAITGIFFQGTDVTERASAEAALREREEQLRLATDAADVGLWDVDVVNDVMFWQPRVKALFGISPNVPVSMADFYAGLHPDDAEATVAAYAAAADPNIRATYDVEYRSVGKEDGVIRWVAAKGKARFDQNGRCVRVIGTAVDISLRKKFEAQILEMNETLEQQVQTRTAALLAAEDQLRQAQKMEAVGQLTGGIAHDFNNLLAGISGSLELLEARLTEGRLSAVPKYIDAAQGAARRAAALTQRLLAFSRRQTLDPKVVAVNRLVGEMMDLIQRSVGPTITLEVMASEDLWPTLIDPNQLENALLNLCINGRDAMPSGGDLKITTENRTLEGAEAKQLDVAVGDYIVLRVSDSGQGMAPEVIDRAFEPFFTTKPLGHGTGLGLSMTYGFVKQSKGQIDITSVIGGGTTICLYLPRYSGVIEPDQTPATKTPEDGRTDDKTIIVIDDEPSVRMLVVDVLKEVGYRTLEAADGPQGYEILQSSGDIDLLITDVGLPGGMNGRQVADAARVMRPNLSVLFITGYAESALLDETQLGPDTQIITKPFQIGALVAKVRSLLEPWDARKGVD
jgi:PAS domain S-box-containing protein